MKTEKLQRKFAKNFVGDSKTKQYFKDECDINKIVSKSLKSGFVTHLSKKSPIFADVSQVKSYSDAVIMINNAERSFMQLPADIRAKFDNDPAKMADSLESGEYNGVLVELGVLEETEQTQVSESVVDPVFEPEEKK